MNGQGPRAQDRSRALWIFTDFLDLENIGGAGRAAWEHARACTERGWEPWLCCGAWSNRRRCRRQGSLRLISFPYHGGRKGPAVWLADLAQAAWFLRRRLRRLPPPRAVFIHQPLAYALWRVALAERSAAAPRRYFFHSPWAAESGEDSPPWGAWARDRLEAAALGAAERIHVASRFMIEHLRRRHPTIPVGRLLPLPYGVSPTFQPSDIALAKSRLGWSPREFIVLATRRLIVRTGVDVLLTTLRALRTRVPDLRLKISGDLRWNDLRPLAARLGVADRVDFLGYLPEGLLPTAYAAADLVVVPSRALEGFGLSTVEALATGRPVLATPVGATPEVVAGFAHAWLSKDASAEALAESIADLRQRLGLNHPGFPEEARRVQARYDWGRYADATLEGLE